MAATPSQAQNKTPVFKKVLTSDVFIWMNASKALLWGVGFYSVTPVYILYAIGLNKYLTMVGMSFQ